MIEVIQAPEQEVCLTGCDTISLTLTIEETGEIVTYEINSYYNDEGGRPVFGEVVDIYYNYDLNRWDTNAGAFLESESFCPFGVYTTTEGSGFSAFEVNGVCFTSKWQAVEHPIKWELQRKDALVDEKDTVSGPGCSRRDDCGGGSRRRA